MKFPVVNRPEYIIYLEDTDGYFFIHCDILVKWTKIVKQKLLKEFKFLTEVVNQPLYALHSPKDVKHKKFLNMFNFKFLKEVFGKDNNEYHIYVWR